MSRKKSRAIQPSACPPAASWSAAGPSCFDPTAWISASWYLRAKAIRAWSRKPINPAGGDLAATRRVSIRMETNKSWNIRKKSWP